MSKKYWKKAQNNVANDGCTCAECSRAWDEDNDRWIICDVSDLKYHLTIEHQNTGLSSQILNSGLANIKDTLMN